MTRINNKLFNEIMQHLGSMVGIVEVSLALDESLRREDLLNLKAEMLKLTELVRKHREVEDDAGQE